MQTGEFRINHHGHAINDAVEHLVQRTSCAGSQRVINGLVLEHYDSQIILINLQKISFDTAENEPSKVWATKVKATCNN